MASRTNQLKARLGANMAESMGVGAGGMSAIAPETAFPENTGGPSKHDGVKAMREARIIRLENLARDPSQPRQQFEAESLDRLARSLTARGQLQPIRVRWSQEQGKYLIVAGERRWRAAMIAGLESLQAVVVDRELSPTEILQEQLVENCLREDLLPIEQAQAFRALMDANGWSARRLAEELSLASSTVVKALALLDLAPEIQEKVEAGELSAASAYEVSKLPDPAQQSEVADRVVRDRMTRDQTAAAVREKSGRRPKTTPAPSPSAIDAPSQAPEPMVEASQPSAPIAASQDTPATIAASQARPSASTPSPRVDSPDRVEFRLDDGTIVSVSSPAALDGPDAVITALERALDRARQVRISDAA